MQSPELRRSPLPSPLPSRGRTASLLGATTVALSAAMVATILTVVLPAVVLAASPSPSQPGAGDPRSSGQGPGLVGDPLTALIIVGAIALASIAATLAYVHLTRDRQRAPRG